MLSSRILVADLLEMSPLLVPWLIELRVDCVGCSLNKFCTLEELYKHYKLDPENINQRLRDELTE